MRPRDMPPRELLERALPAMLVLLDAGGSCLEGDDTACAMYEVIPGETRGARWDLLDELDENKLMNMSLAGDGQYWRYTLTTAGRFIAEALRPLSAVDQLAALVRS